MFETQLYRILNKRAGCDDDLYENEVSLIQFEDEDFYVREFGKFGIILDGVLIDNALGAIIELYASEQVKLFPVKVRRRATDEVWENYSALELFNDLTLSDFDRTDFKGCRIYFFMEDFYITEELKNIIEIEFERADELGFDNKSPFIA